MNTFVVKHGYDNIAHKYLSYRGHLGSSKYVKQFLKYVPKHSLILDLGCGVGMPVDDLLIKAGHSVVGMDISAAQIAEARKNCPGATYLVGDMAHLQAGEYEAQAIVCLYALFHLKRETHLALLKNMASSLTTHGVLLISMGDREFEGNHDLLGNAMWSSQYGTTKNRQLVEQAGFSILLDEIDVSGGERHQIILAEKL